MHVNTLIVIFSPFRSLPDHMMSDKSVHYMTSLFLRMCVPVLRLWEEKTPKGLRRFIIYSSVVIHN